MPIQDWTNIIVWNLPSAQRKLGIAGGPVPPAWFAAAFATAFATAFPLAFVAQIEAIVTLLDGGVPLSVTSAVSSFDANTDDYTLVLNGGYP